MMDNDEGKTAIYEKPRRIIQNQTLIQLLMILELATPIPLAGVLFGLVFAVAPVIVVPSILAVWAVGSVCYIAMRLHVERQNKKS
jgi:hypothetical protein